MKAYVIAHENTENRYDVVQVEVVPGPLQSMTRQVYFNGKVRTLDAWNVYTLSEQKRALQDANAKNERRITNKKAVLFDELSGISEQLNM